MNNCLSIKYSLKYKCILYDLFNNSILISLSLQSDIKM